MSKPDLSISIQDYLKEIYKLQSSGQRATTTAIARAMGVAPSSATSMLKKLAALGLAAAGPRIGGDKVEIKKEGINLHGGLSYCLRLSYFLSPIVKQVCKCLFQRYFRFPSEFPLNAGSIAP